MFDRTVDPRILLVKIDEQSLAAIGPWPWPRKVHADLIDRLSQAGVAAIGYDVLFSERGLPADDQALAAALARSGRVAIPASAQLPGPAGRSFAVRLPTPEIARAAHRIGHVNVLFDRDGKVRRVRMQVAGRTEPMPHLMQELSRDLQPAGQPLPEELVIPFVPAGSVPAVSAEKLLAGDVPPAILKDRIVLVGATVQGLGEVLPVPARAGNLMPGVEVQANILNAILGNSWIQDAGPVPAAAIALGLLVLVMLSYWRLSPDQGLAITLAVALAAVILSFLGLSLLRLWVSPMSLLVALLLAYPLWNWRRLSVLNAFVEQEARWLNLALGNPRGARTGRSGLDSIALAAARLRHLIGELRSRGSFLRDVVEGMPDALGVVDQDGRVVVANQRAKRLFGEDAEGNLARNLLSRITAERPDKDGEVLLSDGRTMLIKRVSLSAHGAEPGGAILRLADISARRNAELAREEALEFLSHDLRAPQASILTLLDAAEANPAAPLPLARIRGYAARSLKLADDFVQLARLATLTPQREPVDLAGVFEEAIDGVYASARAKRVSVTLDAPNSLPPIAADAWLLIRAVGNLLDNAVKYSPPDAIVRCSLSVVPGATAAEQAIVCTIADSGPGIPAERLAALFKRFGTKDTATDRSAGLGLAFASNAVRLLDGTIQCDSSSAGTTFCLTFPAQNLPG